MPSTRSERRQLENRPSTKARSSLGGLPYTPLPSNTIRLFRLSKDTQNSDFHGQLTVVHFSEYPKYTAVSYAWGDQNQEKPSVIKFNNNQILKISQTVHCLLLSIWNRLGAEAPLLWIDQICINQDDGTEKEHQVGLMREVYSEADDVLVWLRDDQESCKISLASQTAQILQNYRHANSAAEHSLSALLSLWRHPWFERLWVRQEVALAKKATFCYGGYIIPLKQLAKACDVHFKVAMSILFSKTKANKTRTTLSQGTTLRQETADSFLQLSRAKELFDFVRTTVPEKTYLRLDLLDIIRYTFDLATAIEHDHVYAIYHLSSAASNHNLWPNYLKPLRQLWREVAAYILNDHSYWNTVREQDQNCACPAVILALPATQKELKSLDSTSWVPDFEKLNTNSAVKFDHYVHYSDIFKAGGSEEFHPIIDQNGRGTLRLEGVVLSRVSAIERDTQQPPVGESVPLEFESIEYWNFVTERLIPWYLKCYRFGKEHNISNFGILLSQGIELPSDTKVSEKKRTKKRTREWRSPKLHKLEGVKIQSPNFPSFSARVLNTFVASEEGIDARQLYDDLFPFIVNVAWSIDNRDWKRVLATLMDGRVGWVPETVEIGDYVILIKGTPFPFVVRQNRHSSLYEMIGDAYIDGIMKGEAWEEKALHVCNFEFR